MSLSLEVNDGDALTTATAFDVTESAEMGQVGQGTITIDDAPGTLDLISHKLIRIGEDDCTDEVLFRGFAGAEQIVRGTRRQGMGRTPALNTLDMNAKAGFKVIRGRAWRKRPVESVGDRLTDLLASDFVAFHDNGFVDYPTALVDGGDLRGMRPGDVLTDLATRVGFNWFIYWDEDATQASLWFKDSNTSTAYSSTLRISNVISDIDGTTTFEASGDTSFTRDPTNLVSGVWMPFKKGNVYRTRPETEDTYEPRDGTAPSSRTKRRKRARLIADRYLRHHKDPEDRIETTVLLPSSRVNLIKAGQRLEAKFSHLTTEGYGNFTWMRVLHREPSWLFSPGGRPNLPGEPLYPVRLTLSPQTTGECVGTEEDIELVQFAMANHPSDTNLDLPDPPTVGNMMILAVGHRDELAVGPMPDGIDGWTRVSDLDPVFARDASTGLGHADLWYRVVESGDTGLVSDFDGMKILMEFSGVTSLLSFAGTDVSGSNTDDVSITSGNLGTAGLAVAAIITRQDDTGRMTEGAGSNKIPLGSGAPPVSNGVGHDELYVLWATTSGDPVTLTGTQTGATNDGDGYWWGGRVACFSVCP